MKLKFMPTEDLTKSRSNLTLLHSKEILKIFSRIYLQFQGFRIWKLNETKRFTRTSECQSECRNTFYGSLNLAEHKSSVRFIFMVLIPTV